MKRFSDFTQFILLLLFFILLSILFPYLKGPAPTPVESAASGSRQVWECGFGPQSTEGVKAASIRLATFRQKQKNQKSWTESITFSRPTFLV
ncbi:hypothetical protein [Brevibacillus sp. SAFN-007a]|uniref:hypothetical protein n=1 Tax=Brevibacillus sp. SAFN-007a TaxID=3436862 RepID=UPI003F813824